MSDDGPDGWYNPETGKWDAPQPTPAPTRPRPVSQPPLQDATIQSVLHWRADSLLLFRLRPLLTEFVYLTERQHCDHQDLGAELSCRDQGMALGDMCFGCRYKIIRDQMEGVV